MTTSRSRAVAGGAGERLVLHIGSGRTGTTTLQGFLAGRRADLASTGVLYPRAPGRRRHVRLSLFARTDEAMVRTRPWLQERFERPDRFRRTLRQRLTDEVRASGLRTVLMSDEALFGVGPDDLPRLRGLLDDVATDLRVIVYLRRQDDHLVSRYQHTVKMGEVRRLVDVVHDARPEVYDYRARLEPWRAQVAPGGLVVRRFDPALLVGGSLLPDFVDAADLGLSLSQEDRALRRNASVDAEGVELLRLVNLHKQQDLGQQRQLIDNRSLVAALARRPQGPQLSVPDPELRAFMVRWHDSNAAVARDLLAIPDESLFPPRRERPVSTRQVLDPERLEDFLRLPEIPAPMHDPLRRIARREARTAG